MRRRDIDKFSPLRNTTEMAQMKWGSVENVNWSLENSLLFRSWTCFTITNVHFQIRAAWWGNLFLALRMWDAKERQYGKKMVTPYSLCPQYFFPSTPPFLITKTQRFLKNVCLIQPKTPKTYLAISFLSLRATIGEIICCSWFTTLQACKTRAL